MLPVTDFNFVVCGFATLAATVGYACARKARPLPSRAVPQPLPGDEPISDPAPESSSKMVVEKPIFVDEPESYTTPSEPTCEPEPGPETTPTTVVRANSSLKRKRTQDQDDAEAHEADPNLSSIYPNKRRSGSVPAEDPTNSANEMAPQAHDSSSSEEPQPATKLELSDPVPSEPNPDVVESSSSPEAPKPVPAFAGFAFPKTPPRITQFPTVRTTASPGFANFGGSSSPFFSTNSQKDSISIASKPIWASTTAAAETTIAGLDGEADETAVSQSALVAVKPQNVTIPHSTGEEDEDIILELKGAKLYIKRGEENFSGGMVGHIKLLSHKTSPLKTIAEPLLEGFHELRCTFDAQENILRVALKELQDKSDSESVEPQTVIYAFKVQPSRSCRKGDFEDFAEALLAQAREGGQS
ncbi:hypothetical protein DFH06DRAFT_1444028 [Mycena polygramma]|nr:hypothetical protein DFH06DRAFT_1444028 [Mycena polygramma]